MDAERLAELMKKGLEKQRERLLQDLGREIHLRGPSWEEFALNIANHIEEVESLIYSDLAELANKVVDNQP